MSETITGGKAAAVSASPARKTKPDTDSADPDVPAGDSPPARGWPLVLFTITWLASIVFLAWMASSRGAGMPH